MSPKKQNSMLFSKVQTTFLFLLLFVPKAWVEMIDLEQELKVRGLKPAFGPMTTLRNRRQLLKAVVDEDKAVIEAFEVKLTFLPRVIVESLGSNMCRIYVISSRLAPCLHPALKTRKVPKTSNIPVLCERRLVPNLSLTPTLANRRFERG